MKAKSETKKLLKGFVTLVKTQFNNGLEFASGSMKKYYLEIGILHQTSCVDTPQENRKVERKHRNLLNTARAIQFQANLSLKFWGECILTTAHLINRTPSNLF